MAAVTSCENALREDSHVPLIYNAEKKAPTYDFAHAQQAKSLSKERDTRVNPDTFGQ